MKLNQTKPHEVSKDPEKDAAKQRAKRKLLGVNQHLKLTP